MQGVAVEEGDKPAPDEPNLKGSQITALNQVACEKGSENVALIDFSVDFSGTVLMDDQLSGKKEVDVVQDKSVMEGRERNVEKTVHDEKMCVETANNSENVHDTLAKVQNVENDCVNTVYDEFARVSCDDEPSVEKAAKTVTDTPLPSWLDMLCDNLASDGTKAKVYDSSANQVETQTINQNENEAKQNQTSERPSMAYNPNSKNTNNVNELTGAIDNKADDSQLTKTEKTQSITRDSSAGTLSYTHHMEQTQNTDQSGAAKTTTNPHDLHTRAGTQQLSEKNDQSGAAREYINSALEAKTITNPHALHIPAGTQQQTENTDQSDAAEPTNSSNSATKSSMNPHVKPIPACIQQQTENTSQSSVAKITHHHESEVTTDTHVVGPRGDNPVKSNTEKTVEDKPPKKPRTSLKIPVHIGTSKTTQKQQDSKAMPVTEQQPHAGPSKTDTLSSQIETRSVTRVRRKDEQVPLLERVQLSLAITETRLESERNQETKQSETILGPANKPVSVITPSTAAKGRQSRTDNKTQALINRDGSLGRRKTVDGLDKEQGGAGARGGGGGKGQGLGGSGGKGKGGSSGGGRGGSTSHGGGKGVGVAGGSGGGIKGGKGARSGEDKTKLSKANQSASNLKTLRSRNVLK